MLQFTAEFCYFWDFGLTCRPISDLVKEKIHNYSAFLNATYTHRQTFAFFNLDLHKGITLIDPNTDWKKVTAGYRTVKPETGCICLNTKEKKISYRWFNVSCTENDI